MCSVRFGDGQVCKNCKNVTVIRMQRRMQGGSLMAQWSLVERNRKKESTTKINYPVQGGNQSFLVGCGVKKGSALSGVTWSFHLDYPLKKILLLTFKLTLKQKTCHEYTKFRFKQIFFIDVI